MKLRLPHKFQAALMAALASVSFTTLSTGTLGVATGAALLAGQKTMAVSLDDAVLQTEDITSTITVDNWTANQMSVAIELDMAAFKNYLTTTWIAGSGTKKTFLEVEGTWNNTPSGQTNTVGLHMDGSSGSKYGTPYGQGTYPGGSGNVKLNNLSESLKFTEETNWDNYEAMSVVLTFNGASEMTATWYIKNTDGTTSTYYGTQNGTKWGSSTAFTPDGTIKNIDTSMVNYVAVFNSKLNQADSATIASAVLTRTPSGYGMEFSGDVFTIEHASNHAFHNATFSSWYQDENGQWKKGSHTWAGDSTSYYVGEQLMSVTGGSFWRSLFGDGQGGYSDRLGNTIRLTGATGNVYFESEFSPYQLGGIIAEEGNSGTYVLGRHNGNCAIHIKAREGQDANMYIASNVGISSATSIDIESSGTWRVFNGKSLTFALYNNTGNVSSVTNTPSLTFHDGVEVEMTGGGTIDMTHTDNLTIERGAVISVGADTTVKFASNTTLGSTITNAGTVNFEGEVTLTADLSGFDHDISSYTNEQGVSGADGFANGVYYTIINNSGTSNLESVKLAGASTATTLDGQGRIYVGDTQYGTYYINTNGATLDLDAAVAYAEGHGAGVTLSHVEVDAASASINVANTQSLALLSGAGDVAKTGSGTLMLTGSNTGYTGAVNVTAGTLDLASSMGLSALSVANGATLKLAGAGMLSAGNLTLASGSVLDVSNVAQMAGVTVDLASYTGTVSYEGATVSGVGSWLDYTLNAADGMLRLTFASKPQPVPTPVADLGKVMYVGDSITDGVTGGGVHAKSWRYSFFQVLADGGISQVEEGYYQHTQSSGAITTTTYGGRTFENIHSAKASARSWETAGTRNGGRYDSSNIKNWLGQSNVKTNGQAYPADKPVYSGADAPNTYFMLLGTNDLLSEGGDHVGESHFNSVLSSMFGYSGGSFDGQSGTFDIIWKSMTDARSDAKLVVLEMPTWSPDHGNHQYASDFAYLAKFNQKLHEWADSKNSANITIVNPNPGIVDVSNTTKPGSGVPTMFIDGLHPSAQGELLMAGNIAKQLGYAGRSVGLDRAAYTAGSADWHTAGTDPITVVAGASAQTIAEATFTVRDGYTIDFSAVYGNGLAGGWSEAGNALSITVGDGSHTGTLSFSEAYVMWDNTILYSRDNHVAGDNFRIAYVNQSVTPTDNVSAGYYVWMGDQLIGEALTATTGTGLLNGIQLSATGANGTVSGLTWADKAYAPTTERYVNEDEAFHLEQAYANPVHDNPEHSSLNINFTDATPVNNQQYATGGQPAEGKILAEHANFGNSWFGPAGHNHTDNIEVEYSGVTSTLNMFGVINAAVTGDVSTVIGGGSTFGKGDYSSSGQCSIIGAYQKNGATSISGTLSIEINDATLAGGILMGASTGTASIGATDLRINSGAVVNGNIFGGHHQSTGSTTGDANITITGGTINGSVYGGNMGAGTIGGNVNITITGGIITGDVNGGGTGGTISGKSNVTIEGNLPAISGNISADNVTLSNVSLNELGYNDGFDYYRGTITGTETITLDHYTVADMRASLVTKTLVLSNMSSTTIHNLTLTACEINVDGTSSATLADSVTLGNTATYTGTLNLADGLEIDVTDMGITGEEKSVNLFTTQSGTLNANASQLTIVGLAQDAPEYYLSNTNNNLVLTFGAQGQDLIWDGGEGTWDVGTTAHWHKDGEQAGSSTFAEGDNVTFQSGAGRAQLQENITAGTMTLESGANVTVNTNNHDLTVAALESNGGSLTKTGAGTAIFGEGEHLNLSSLSTSGGTTVFEGHVSVTGADKTAYWVNFNANTELMDGFSFSGSGKNDYAFLVGSNATVTLHGDTNVSDYLIGPAAGTKVVLAEGASLTVKQVMNSSANKGSGNGALDMKRGSVLTLTGTNLYLTGASSEGGTIHLGNGALVNLYAGSYQPNIMEFGLGNIALDGNSPTATIKTTNWGGTVKLDSLSGSGTLVLRAEADSSVRNTFSIGGNATEPAFTGKIALQRATGTNRVLLAEFNDEWSAAGAVVEASLDGSHTSEAVGIAINNDTVKMKGLNDGAGITSASSYALFSGSALNLPDTANNGAAGYLNNASDGTARTLEFVGTDATASSSTAIKVLNNVNLKMSSAGSQSFTGNLSAMNGAVTASAGTLTLDNSGATAGSLASVTVNGGTLVLDDMNVSGAVTLSSGTLDLRSDISTIGSLDMMGGTLKLAGAGSLTSTGTLHFGSDAILDLANITVSGASPITLMSTTGSITGTLSDVEITNLNNVPTGYTYSLQDNSGALVLTFTPEYDGLIWNNEDGNWSTQSGDAHWHTAADTTAHLPFTSNSNVRFDSNANNHTVTLTENITAGTVEIMDGVTVKIVDGNKTLTGTLKGSGTYELAAQDKTLPVGLTKGDDWTGAVLLKDETIETNSEEWMNALSRTGETSNSWLELSGFTGFDKSWASSANNYPDLTANIRLTDSGDNPAWKFTASATGTGYTMNATGKWEGDGEFRFTSDKQQGIKFTGDISGWDGKLTSQSTGARTVTFAGEADEVNVQIANQGSGTLNIVVGDGTDADFDATFGKSINASSLEIKENAGATFEDTVAVSGALKLDANTTSHFKDNVTAGSVAVGDNKSTGATATFDGTLTVSGAFTMNGTTAVPASVALNGDTTVNGNFDLSNDNKANGTVTVAANKTLDLNGAVWMNSNSTLALGQGATAEMGTSISLVGLTGGGTVSSSASAQFALNSDSYTVDNVKATFNTGNDNVQLLFTDSQIESAQHVTLKNTGNTLTSTTVRGDTLTVAAGMDLGTVTVNSGAELALTSSGVTIGSGSIASGATLKLSDSPFSVDSGEFSLASGSILDLTSWTSITGETPITLGTANGGSFSTAGLSGVDVHLDPSITQQHTLEVVNGNLVLTFTQPEPTDYLVWQGGPGTWNTNSDNKSWFESEDSQEKVAFETGDSVAFMVAVDSPVTIGEQQITAGNVRIDSGVNVTLESEGSQLVANKITVDGDLTVRNVAVQAQSMVISEGGHATANVEGDRTGALATNVSGAGDVTKIGTGNLALTGNNSGFTGTLTIEEGAVVAASSKALGNTPDIVLAGGNLAGATGVTVAPTGDINITSTQDGTVSANMQVASDRTLTFNTDANTTLTESGVISGSGSIVKDGTGTLVLDANNTYTGNLNINQGTVLVSNVGALGGEGSQRVNVSDGATLSFVNKKDDTPTYTADYIAVARGASLTFAGTDKLDIGTLSLDGASAVDLSNIVVDHYGEYVLADVDSLVTPERYGILSGDLVEFVSMKNFKPETVTEGEPWSFKDQDLISLHYKNKQLVLEVHEANPGYYWIPSETTTRADWNTSDKNWSSTADLKNPTLYVNQEGTKATAANSVYFLNPGGSGDETIDVEISGGYIYVRDFIIANGVYNFTTDDGTQKTIRLDENRLSNFVVRSGAEAHFTRLQVDGGMNDVTHVCKDAVLTMDEVAWMWGEYSLNNEGYYHVQGEGYQNLMGHVDNSGTMEVLMWSMDRAGVQMLSDIQIGTVMNREGAKLTLFAYSVATDTTGTYGDGILHNEGSVTLGGKDGLEMFDEMSNALPVMGNGTLATVGDDLTVYQMEEVQQTSATFGAMRTELAGGATIGDVKLKANTETAFGPHQQLSEYGFPTGVIEPMDYTLGAVRAETGSTMEVQKGATVVIDGFNADLVSDSPTGKLLVGPYNVFDEEETMATASLTVNGITKAAELEVQDGGEVNLDGYATVTTLTQSGGAANFNAGGFVDNGTVSGGTLAIGDDQVLTLGAVITETGNYTVDQTTGSINADALELHKDMTNAGYVEVHHTTEEKTKDQSGFLSGGEQYVQVFNIQSGTLTANDVTVTHKDAAGPMTLISTGEHAGRGYLDTSETVYTTYYVRDNYVVAHGEERPADYVTLSQVIATATAGGETLAAVVFDQTGYNNAVDGSKAYHGTLTVDTNTKADLFRVTNSGTEQEPDPTRAAINIASNAEVLADQDYAGVEGTLELAGSGVYQIDNRGDLGTHVSLLAGKTDGVDPWSGTVRLTGTAEGVNTTPLSVGESTTASTIEFNQWHGSFLDTGDTPMQSNAKILLTGTGVQGDPAITLTEGDANLLWTNTVSGEGGRIDHSQAGDFTLTMTGDTHAWNGTFNQAAEDTTVTLGFLDNVSATGEQSASVLASAGTMDVTYGGNVKTVNGDAVVYGTGDMNLAYTGKDMQVNSNISKYNGQGTLDITVGDEAGTEASATFNGDITADTLTVKADSAATLDNTTNISETVAVEADASLSIQSGTDEPADTAVITSSNGTDNATITGGVTMQSTDEAAIIAGTAGEEPVTRVDGADVAVLNEAASLQLENLVLAADTMVHGTDKAGNLVISQKVVQEMRDTNAKHTKPDSTITSALTMTGTTDTTLEYDKDNVYNVDFTSMCQMAQISGSAGTLVFDFTEMPEYYDWEKTFSGYGFVGVNFDIDDQAIDASHLTVTALTKAADGQVVERIGYYYNGGDGAVVGSIIYFQVPEPTTGTLSLLALAALAARRRRK